MRVGLALALLLWLLIFMVWDESGAGDWSVQIPITSWHKSDGFECNGVQRNYNDSNLGLIVGYKWLRVGRYENSYSGCADEIKYSNLLALEAPLGEWQSIKFSFTGGLADGYREDNPDGFGEYRPFASVNAQWGVLKVMYGYEVAGAGLQLDW